MQILFIIIIVAIGLIIADQICLWLENKAKGSATGSALLELQNILNPSTQHIIEAKQEKTESEQSNKEKEKLSI